MSNDQNENTHAGRKPDLGAYNVKNSPDGKAYWNKIGSAWTHQDGKGVNLNLDSVPVDGKVVLREMRDERMQDYKQAEQSQQNQPAHNRTKGYEQER